MLGIQFCLWSNTEHCRWKPDYVGREKKGRKCLVNFAVKCSSTFCLKIKTLGKFWQYKLILHPKFVLLQEGTGVYRCTNSIQGLDSPGMWVFICYVEWFLTRSYSWWNATQFLPKSMLCSHAGYRKINTRVLNTQGSWFWFCFKKPFRLLEEGTYAFWIQ